MPDPNTGATGTTDNWSVLWGNIRIGSPEQPHAGNAATWWVPDSVFGYDMSNYYYLHDKTFDTDLSLSRIDRILEIEYDAFVAGLHPNAVHIAVQVIYSSATLMAGLSVGASNSLKDALGFRKEEKRR
jgi:hypothetical protein